MKRGWCPSLYEPMPAKDGLLLRVKPFAGQLSANAAMTLAAAATRFGNGMIQLTNRANLQFRGFSAESAPAFADVAGGLGLADTRPGVERRRNVLVSPLAGHDPSVHPATLDVARAMEALLVETDAFTVLPAKFGIVVDGGGAAFVRDAPGDIIVVLRGDAALISLDGEAGIDVAPSRLVGAVGRLIHAFILQGPPSRLRNADQSRLLADAGLATSVVLERTASLVPVGAASFGFGVGVAFGQMDSAGLQVLASAAGDDGIFITPWRSVMLTKPPSLLAHPALITAASDIRLSMSACIGKQGCEQGSVETLKDAALLAKSGRFGGASVHVSGCAKGCAHRRASAYTLVGDGGRYNLVRNAGADGTPILRGLTISELVAHSDLEDFA